MNLNLSTIIIILSLGSTAILLGYMFYTTERENKQLKEKYTDLQTEHQNSKENAALLRNEIRGIVNILESRASLSEKMSALRRRVAELQSYL